MNDSVRVVFRNLEWCAVNVNLHAVNKSLQAIKLLLGKVSTAAVICQSCSLPNLLPVSSFSLQNILDIFFSILQEIELLVTFSVI